MLRTEPRPGQLGESPECRPRAWTSVHGAVAFYVNLMKPEFSLTSVYAPCLAPTLRLLGPSEVLHEPQIPQDMALVTGPGEPLRVWS